MIDVWKYRLDLQRNLLKFTEISGRPGGHRDTLPPLNKLLKYSRKKHFHSTFIPLPHRFANHRKSQILQSTHMSFVLSIGLIQNLLNSVKKYPLTLTDFETSKWITYYTIQNKGQLTLWRQIQIFSQISHPCLFTHLFYESQIFFLCETKRTNTVINALYLAFMLLIYSICDS